MHLTAIIITRMNQNRKGLPQRRTEAKIKLMLYLGGLGGFARKYFISICKNFTFQILAVTTIFFGCAAPMPDQGGLGDIFEILERQGYQANVGLAGIYEPGNILQTTQAGLDGKPAALASPLVFAWGSDCFPGRTPHIAPFVLPDSQGYTGKLNQHRRKHSESADSIAEFQPSNPGRLSARSGKHPGIHFCQGRPLAPVLREMCPGAGPGH